MDRPDADVTPGSFPNISLVIPAWNEERDIGVTLTRYLPILQKHTKDFEVLVVADGCTDGTPGIVESFQDSRIRAIRFGTRLGKGGALRLGMLASRYDSVGFVDADGPITPADLGGMIEKLARFDAVIGSRWIRGSRTVKRQPVPRIFASRLWNILVRLVLNMRIADTQCGAKLFRRDALLRALGRVTVNNWAFDTALLYEALRSGDSVLEYPVTWSDRSRSKLKIRRAAPEMLMSLLQLRKSRALGPQVSGLLSTTVGSGTNLTPATASGATRRRAP